MKYYYYPLIYLLLLFLPSSCTLYMDDLAIPEEQQGIGEEYTKTLDSDGMNGYITFEYKDSVKVITENVEEYIHTIQADSIIYYLENTPPEYIPNVGDKISKTSTRLQYAGLNNRVLEVSRVNGFIKVVTTPCSLNEVYKKLEMDYDVDLKYPSITALDSALVDSLGVDLDEYPIVNWNLFDNREAEYEDGPLRKAPRKALIDGPTFLEDYFTVDPSDSYFNIIDIDTRKLISGDNVSNMKMTQGAMNAAKLFGIASPYMRLLFKANIDTKLHISAGLTVAPVGLRIEIDGHVKPSFTFSDEFGFSVTPSYDIVKKFIDALSKNKETVAPELPAAVIPIPVVTPAVTGKLKPRFKLTSEFSLCGKVERTVHLRPYNIHMAADVYPAPAAGLPPMVVLDLLHCSCTVEDAPTQESSTTCSIQGKAQVGISGGIEIGVSVCKFVDAVLFVDLEGYAYASADRVKTPLGSMLDFPAYTPGNNQFVIKIDCVPGAEFSIAKLKWPKEFARINLAKWDWQLKPSVSNFGIHDAKYNENGILKSCRFALEFEDDGWFDNFKDDVMPFVTFQPHGETNPKNYITCYGSGDSHLSTSSPYMIDCDLSSYNSSEPTIFTVYPGLKLMNRDGEEWIISGEEMTVVGNQTYAVLDWVSCTQTYGNPVKDLSAEKIKAMKKEYGLDVSPWWVYGCNPKVKLTGGTNVKEWGFAINIRCDEGDGYVSVLDQDIPVERTIEAGGSLAEINSGTKDIFIEYVDSKDPGSISDDEEEKAVKYKITLQPYIINKKGDRIQASMEKRRVSMKYPVKNPKGIEKNIKARLADGGTQISL